MASRLASYEPAGTADPGSAKRAAGMDLALAAAAAILLWPFPLVRLTLGIPWAVHGPLIVAWILVMSVAYLTLCVWRWGRTPAMYFLDLGLAGPPRPFGLSAALRWALAATLAVVPALLGASGPLDPQHGLPARWSGLLTVSAPAADEDVQGG